MTGSQILLLSPILVDLHKLIVSGALIYSFTYDLFGENIEVLNIRRFGVLYSTKMVDTKLL